MPKLFWIILTMLKVDHSQECEKVLQQECAGIREFFQHSQLTFQVLQHTYEKKFLLILFPYYVMNWKACRNTQLVIVVITHAKEL